ncbi:dTMP kinase [Dokdonia ponticola]|uniref:dTMP kinase n=1 Tax=Dokdonia ponticola TaxID=2041041 RepID=A0ABV9I0X3_9FLAO
MSNKKPIIICITGPDGSGKSTLVSHLVATLPNAIEVTVWDALNNGDVALFSSKKDIDQYLCLLSPDARLLFLAHALKYATDKALDSGKELIILNAYYYKYFASEAVLGANEGLIHTLASAFPTPDRTIFLSLSPAISAVRKNQLSRYECGCKEATVENFIDFQKKATLAFEAYIQPDWFVLNTEESLEVIKDKTLKIIAQ